MHPYEICECIDKWQRQQNSTNWAIDKKKIYYFNGNEKKNEKLIDHSLNVTVHKIFHWKLKIIKCIECYKSNQIFLISKLIFPYFPLFYIRLCEIYIYENFIHTMNTMNGRVNNKTKKLYSINEANWMAVVFR